VAPAEYKPLFPPTLPVKRLPSTYARRREVAIGSVTIGGDNAVAVQSMTNTDTSDVDATVAQIRRLEEVGCEIVRVAVPDRRSAEALPAIKEAISLPLVADIHFNPELALAALEAGVDKLRLNPGNISTRERLEPIARELARRGTPVRVGANAGSIPSDLKIVYERDPVAAIVQGAHRYVEMLQEFGVSNIVVALKSSDVPTTVESYRRFASESDLPLHIGITEAGPGITGAARSAVGIGILLTEGLGDTLRVSISGDPVDEITVCREILSCLGLARAPRLIACPTCARAEFDVPAVAERIRGELMKLQRPVTVAVMGCVVNGPGEAEEADLGLVGSGGKFVLYVRGKMAAKDLELDEAVQRLITKIDSMETAP
jgi:(E)-4-hydroxy-3-methylbut-2-enyl-diphosphate synthase